MLGAGPGRCLSFHLSTTFSPYVMTCVRIAKHRTYEAACRLRRGRVTGYTPLPRTFQLLLQTVSKCRGPELQLNRRAGTLDMRKGHAGLLTAHTTTARARDDDVVGTATPFASSTAESIAMSSDESSGSSSLT